LSERSLATSGALYRSIPGGDRESGGDVWDSQRGSAYGVRGKENEARKVAMYLVGRRCDQTLSETAKLFGLGSYGAVGSGLSRSESEDGAGEEISRSNGAHGD